MNAIGALTPCGFGDTLVHGDEPMTQPNALACEYQRDYGSARGDLDVSDLINNPEAGGKCRVFGLGLGEESLDFGSDGSAGFQNPPELLEPVPGFPPLRGNPEPTTVLEPTLPEWMPPRATCHCVVRSCPLWALRPFQTRAQRPQAPDSGTSREERASGDPEQSP